MPRKVLLPLLLLASASLVACVRDSDSAPARTAFDEDLPLDIPSWVTPPAQQASIPAPPRIRRTIEFGSIHTDRSPSAPVTAVQPEPAAASAQGGAPTPVVPFGVYGFVGYDGYYRYDDHAGDFVRYPSADASPSGSRSCSSHVTSPKAGDDWPAVRDFGPSFPFTWANPMR